MQQYSEIGAQNLSTHFEICDINEEKMKVLSKKIFSLLKYVYFSNVFNNITIILCGVVKVYEWCSVSYWDISFQHTLLLFSC